MFWFNEGEDSLTHYSEEFYELGNLLTRLINKVYDGKKIKFINIEFSTEKTYKLNPHKLKNEHFYKGVDLFYFSILIESILIVWRGLTKINFYGIKLMNFLKSLQKLSKTKSFWKLQNMLIKKVWRWI